MPGLSQTVTQQDYHWTGSNCLKSNRQWKPQSSRDERAALQRNDGKTNVGAKKWIEDCEKTSEKVGGGVCGKDRMLWEVTAALPRAVLAGGQS